MESTIKSISRASLSIYVLNLLLLSGGFALSILSWMHICTEACSAGHKYRLYGFAFEPIGIAFFLLASILWGFTLLQPRLRLLVGAMVASSLGAEITFVYAQKYIIGHWCPICLSIATVVLTTFVLLSITYFQELIAAFSRNDRGGIMTGLLRGGFALVFVAAGFMFAEFGFTKFNKLQALEQEMKQNIAFGNTKSNVEVYVFTDWKCPSCHKVWPSIVASAPKIMEKASVVFIDMPIHDESLNFTPYNLSFMIHNKSQYLQLHTALEEIAQDTDTPKDDQVSAAANKLGVTYKQLNYADVASGMRYFKYIAEQFDIHKTPMVVIVDNKTKKGKKLAGSEITEKNILNAIKMVD